jgi:hypothetical protein
MMDTLSDPHAHIATSPSHQADSGDEPVESLFEGLLQEHQEIEDMMDELSNPHASTAAGANDTSFIWDDPAIMNLLTAWEQDHAKHPLPDELEPGPELGYLAQVMLLGEGSASKEGASHQSASESDQEVDTWLKLIEDESESRG